MKPPHNAKELLDRLHHYYMKRHTGTISFESNGSAVTLSMKKGDIVTARGEHFDEGKGFMGLLGGEVNHISFQDAEDTSPGHPINSAMEMILFEMAAGMDVKVNRTLDNVRKTGKLPPDITRTVVVECRPEPEQKQQIFLLEEGETVLGRSAQADLVVIDTTISRRHAIIRIHNRTATVDNISASNGTFINRQLIVSSELNEGNLLSLGKTMFKFFWSDCGRGILFRMNDEPISPEDQNTIVLPK